jgi:hypothetical protein
MGSILSRIARIIATGERVAGPGQGNSAGRPAALASWYSTHLDCTLDVLTATPADSPAWTFSSRAASGIEEFLTEFLPGLLAQPEVGGLTGTLHLHATD